MNASLTIAARVAARRHQADLSQTYVARQMQASGFAWHQQTVNKVERGERAVRLHEAPVLAAVLRTSVADLLGESAGADAAAYREGYADGVARAIAAIRALTAQVTP